MSSYAMQGAPDNGFSLMTDCPAVTQFMLNSFSAVQFHKCNFVGLCRIVLDWGGGGGGGASRRNSQSLPPVMIPLLYSIVLFSA